MSFFDIYDLKQLENLELLAKKVVEGFIIGLHKSPFHGFSVEFAEHRLYNQGEDTKTLDWKVYARTDKLFSKKYEEETNLRCHIVMDTSSSMYFPKELKIRNLTINKLQFSALAAASLFQLTKKQRDAFGLSLFDENLYLHSKDRSSSLHMKLMLNHLESAIHRPNPLNRKGNTADILHQVADRIHKRSLVIIFSDFFDNDPDLLPLFSAFQHLNYNKHEVIVIDVRDDALELEFEFENRPYLFVDMETGEKIKLQSDELKDKYIEKIRERKKEISQKCLQYKIDYVPANIREGFFPLLRNYLVKRNKMN